MANDDHLPAGFWNPCDNDLQRDFAFAGIGYTSNLVGRNSTFLERNNKELFPILYCLARGEAYLAGYPDIQLGTLVTAVANAVAPGLPALDAAAADARVLLQLAKFLKMEVQPGKAELLTLNDAIWANERAEGGLLHGIQWMPDTRAGLADLVIPAEVTRAQVRKVLRMLGTHPSSYLARVGALMYSTFYIALAKQGNVHAKKLEKLKKDVGDLAGFEIDLTAEGIKTVYQHVVVRIPPERIGPAVEVMERQMTALNIRLAVTLQQAAGGGLTGLKIVRRAMLEHPTFDWAKVAAVYPREAEKLLLAVNTVGNDRYFGFRRDLGAAKATNYPSYVWIALRLLRHVGGADNVTLANYAGGPKGIVGQEDMEAMIGAYVVPATAQNATPESRAQSDALTAALQAAGGLQ